ncbi:hypothetical protein SSX86_032992 [Deinandra increscens subsp. villosa]|uniref:DUF7780 domain-containing protein n=1 Tax=Deinandra increscens subsp. villosa TaxID=3103831 RepID=A0AAP0GH69_9ASTR
MSITTHGRSSIAYDGRSTRSEVVPMGIFLIFFPEEHPQPFNSSFKTPSLNSNSNSSSILKRTNSTGHIFTRTQSTISVCALLIFLTLLVFTLSSFEPNNDFISSSHRRFLSQNPPRFHPKPRSDSPALQNLGNSVHTWHHRHERARNLSRFRNCNRRRIQVVLERLPPLGWRKENPFGVGRLKPANSSSELTESTQTTRLSYGSVVGFGIGELDPENSLSGFLDHAPMSLRRWASYPMVLGRVRRKFKHVMLVDVKEVLLLGDPLGRVKKLTPESIILSSTPGRVKKPNKTHRKVINPSLVIGGERGVRRLAAAMLTEIVRSTTRQNHHKQNSITESALLSQLAGNEFLQKSIRFISSTELIQDPSQLGGVELANMTAVRRGNSNLDFGAVILKHICSFPIDSLVYTGC